jgi:hypothetical protein
MSLKRINKVSKSRGLDLRGVVSLLEVCRGGVVSVSAFLLSPENTTLERTQEGPEDATGRHGDGFAVLEGWRPGEFLVLSLGWLLLVQYCLCCPSLTSFLLLM